MKTKVLLDAKTATWWTEDLGTEKVIHLLLQGPESELYLPMFTPTMGGITGMLRSGLWGSGLVGNLVLRTKLRKHGGMNELTWLVARFQDSWEIPRKTNPPEEAKIRISGAVTVNGKLRWSDDAEFDEKLNMHIGITGISALSVLPTHNIEFTHTRLLNPVILTGSVQLPEYFPPWYIQEL